MEQAVIINVTYVLALSNLQYLSLRFSILHKYNIDYYFINNDIKHENNYILLMEIVDSIIKQLKILSKYTDKIVT